MPNVAARPSEWLPGALAIVLAVTAARVALLAANRTDLFVDEAQYWYWGENLALGYYSKPPLIGWVIRASTELGGSDAAFWVRLPAPIFHAATALILAWIAAARTGRAAALWVAALYITLPMVTVGSQPISTDTIMFPFLAAALGLWLAALDRGGHPGFALAAGAALGLGFLAKYAAIYGAMGAALAAIFMWQGRPGWRAGLLAVAGFLLAISPNVAWNVANGLATLEHTLDNADWVRNPAARAGLNLAGLVEFFLAQFVVFGPVLFAALLWLGLRRGGGVAERQLLLWFSLPVVALVCAQALLSQAYANWAVAAYLPGLLAVVPWLLGKGRAWLWASLALHGAFAALLPLGAAFPEQLRLEDGRLVYARYLGRAEMSRDILALVPPGGTLVADGRDILADLFHTGRDADVPIYAEPPHERTDDHYELTRALPEDVSGPVLFVDRDRPESLPDACGTPAPVARFAPEEGAYRGRAYAVWRLPAACLR